MSGLPGKVLIVDDEPSIRRALRTTFGTLGFDIAEAVTGEQAIPLLRASNFDAVLLDVNMPGMGGIQTCREIRRQFPHLAVLMLTVRNEEDDKVEALEAGADDYVTKPFPIRELVARVRAAVRRSQNSPVNMGAVIKDAVITIGQITLDPARRMVQKNGVAVRLTPKEFDLLHHLMKNAGLPMMHARLLSAVWGPEYGNELEYLRTFMRQLRKKLEDDAAHPTYLLTDSHIGYRFREA
ncbi:MAG: response regulator transcription factor [Bryobacteraceae bacterium]|jgi:two-component system KDP operon response regulator KdpE